MHTVFQLKGKVHVVYVFLNVAETMHGIYSDKWWKFDQTPNKYVYRDADLF